MRPQVDYYIEAWDVPRKRWTLLCCASSLRMARMFAGREETKLGASVRVLRSTREQVYETGETRKRKR